VLKSINLMHVVVVRCSVKVKEYLIVFLGSALRLVSTSLRSKRNVNPKGLVRSTSEVLSQLFSSAELQLCS